MISHSRLASAPRLASPISPLTSGKSFVRGDLWDQLIRAEVLRQSVGSPAFLDAQKGSRKRPSPAPRALHRPGSPSAPHSPVERHGRRSVFPLGESPVEELTP
jgi:hypothetical protein